VKERFVFRVVLSFLSMVPFVTFASVDTDMMKVKILKKYSVEKPKRWGMFIPGVVTHIKTSEKIIALTFDACAGSQGKKYDKELIQFLKSNSIPATLFVTQSWISYNEKAFDILAKDPLFEIENHGMRHRPASVSGGVAWGIKGTASVAECYDEVELSARGLEKKTGKRPKFYRSGTAYFDDVAVKIIRETGQIPLNFSGIIADVDQHTSLEKVKKRIHKYAKPGAILIMHFNHPGGKTFLAVREIIPQLKAQGYSFVRLADVADKLK
jgi:peptidoglycan/xylan/chitin deacetylase (PgdA/CDA1 family)